MEQEWRAFLIPTNPNPDPHKQILIELGHFVTMLQRQQHIIRICIDANDHERTSPFTKFYNDIDLVDIIANNRPLPLLHIYLVID